MCGLDTDIRNRNAERMKQLSNQAMTSNAITKHVSIKVMTEHFQRRNVRKCVLNPKAESCSCTACKKCRHHSLVQRQRTFGDNCSPDTIKHTGVPTCRCLHPDLGGIKRMAHQGHARPSDRTRQAWTQLAHEHNVKLLHRARGGHHCP